MSLPETPLGRNSRTFNAGAARRRRNRTQIALFLFAMAALLAYCGWIVAGWDGVLWSLLAGVFALAMVRQMPTKLFLATMRARPVAAAEAPELIATFAALSRRAGLSPVPRLYRIAEALPIAFSLGEGESAAVVVADSLFAGLTGRELAGILAHEIAHLRNRDILLQQLAVVLGGLARLVSQLGFLMVFVGILLRVFSLAAFPLPALVVLAVAPIGIGLLRLALLRAREGEADLEAAELTGDPVGLALALDKVRRWQERRLRRLFPAAHPLHLPTLLADHPPTEERIRRLMRQVREHR
jgi:heat shock protein HtpX